MALGLAAPAFASGLSYLSVTAYLDSHENPVPRAAEDGSVPINLAGNWFDSGSCELLVDGSVVASSADALQTYALAADATTWRNYTLTLRSEEGETTRVITVLPYAGFLCSIHYLDHGVCDLDARPVGTVRRLLTDSTMPVTWSAIWNDEATAPVIAIRKGNGLEGDLIDTLLTGEADEEGDFSFVPHTYRLGPGLYTLTHYDGVETLWSVIAIRNHALIFSIH